MTHFGTTTSGKDVAAITLRAHGLSVTVLTYGAIVQDVRLDGVAHALTVGSGTLADYEGDMRYYGCVVGPVANRLQDGAAVIAGKPHEFGKNLNGRHTLHGGTDGAQTFVWDIAHRTNDSLTLSHNMPDGRGGFPANRRLTARFDIAAGPTLRLTLTTTTDAPSIANATNHSYWNLDGTADFSGHQIKIAADYFLPADPVDNVVTGEVREVQSTPYDFRDWTAIAPNTPPLDQTFCIAQDRRELAECLWLLGTSGVSLTVATTEAGMHIYDARDRGHAALAIEAQGWPDAPNKPHFPSIDITPDRPAVQITEWRFSKG